MQACWSLEPTERPTFDQIGCFIQKELEVHKEQVRTFEENGGDVLSSYMNLASGQLPWCWSLPLTDGTSLVLVGSAERHPDFPVRKG